MVQMREEKSEVCKCFSGLKPGDYQLKLIYSGWERETNRLKETDRRLYQFVLIRWNKETDLNFKYYPAGDHIYLGEFGAVQVTPVLKWRLHEVNLIKPSYAVAYHIRAAEDKTHDASYLHLRESAAGHEISFRQ